MRSSLGPLLLAALVVLAGCGTAPTTPSTVTTTTTSSPTPTRTQTATASPTPTPTARPSVENFPYPEGADAGGFDDPEAVGALQERLLANHSHVVRYRATVRSGPGTGERVRSTIRVGEATVRYERTEWTRSNGTLKGRTVSTWAGPGGTAIKLANASGSALLYRHYGARYRRLEGVPFNIAFNYVPGRGAGSATVDGYLAAFEYEAVERFERNGHAYVRYESTGTNPAWEGNAGFLTPTVVEPNVTVMVREDGLVTAIRGSYVAVVEGNRSRRTINYSVSGWEQTTPDRPDWLATELSRVEVTTVGNGTVLRISHEGGLPMRDTTIILAAEGSDFVRVGRLVDDERIYLTANRSNGSWVLTVHDEQPPDHWGSVNFSSLARLRVAVEGDLVALYWILQPGAETAGGRADPPARDGFIANSGGKPV